MNKQKFDYFTLPETEKISLQNINDLFFHRINRFFKEALENDIGKMTSKTADDREGFLYKKRKVEFFFQSDTDNKISISISGVRAHKIIKVKFFYLSSLKEEEECRNINELFSEKILAKCCNWLKYPDAIARKNFS